jgi:hypothetical protein
MAAFLTFRPLLAKPTVLGVVVAADRVQINTTAVTAGATVYDGDRFSTEDGGWLLMRIGTAMLELAEASVVSVRNRANSTQGMEVELGNGTLEAISITSSLQRGAGSFAECHCTGDEHSHGRRYENRCGDNRQRSARIAHLRTAWSTAALLPKESVIE